jgi:nicotinamide-nucleotide adenylyltransferase
MAVALFVARFQPMHKGHERAIKNLLKKYEKVVIVIAAADKSRSERNPFTVEERKAMIEMVFSKEIEQGKIQVIPIEDKASDEEWANEIISKVQFDEVVTASDWVAKCFEGKKVVRRAKLYKGDVLNSTNIRRMIKEGNREWKKLVNKKIANYIYEVALKNFFYSLPS